MEISQPAGPEAVLLEQLCKHGDFDQHDRRATTAAHALRERLGFTASPAGIRTASRLCSGDRKETVNKVLEDAGLRMAESDRVMGAIVDAGKWEESQEQQRREEQQQSGQGQKGQMQRRGSSRGSSRGSTSGSSKREEDAEDDGEQCMPVLAKWAPLLALGHKNVVNSAVTAAATQARKKGLFWNQADARRKHPGAAADLRGVKSGKKAGENYEPDGASLMNKVIADIKLTTAWEKQTIQASWPTLQGLEKFSTLDNFDAADTQEVFAMKQLERWFADRINQGNESRNQQDSTHAGSGKLAL